MNEETQFVFSPKVVLQLLLATLIMALFCYLFDLSDRAHLLPIINLGGLLFCVLCFLFGVCYAARRQRKDPRVVLRGFGRAAFALAAAWFVVTLLWTNSVPLWKLADRIFGHESSWNGDARLTPLSLMECFIRLRIIDYPYLAGLLLCFTSYAATARLRVKAARSGR